MREIHKPVEKTEQWRDKRMEKNIWPNEYKLLAYSSFIRKQAPSVGLHAPRYRTPSTAKWIVHNHFNVIIQYMYNSEWSLPFTFCDQHFVRACHFFLRATRPALTVDSNTCWGYSLRSPFHQVVLTNCDWTKRQAYEFLEITGLTSLSALWLSDF